MGGDVSEMHRAAELSPDGVYRYWLLRRWDDGDTLPLAWVMFNPSTADAVEDDNTIRRVIGFSRSWGYGSAIVVNLFAYRATDPKALRAAADPVGPLNDMYIGMVFEGAASVVAAWSALQHPLAAERTARVRELAADTGHRLQCLGRTKAGQPRHPLYLPRVAQLEALTPGGTA